MLALDELKSAEEAHGKIMEEVRAGMQMLIEEQTEVKRRDHTLLEKYTDLDDNIKKLKEETGRDVTIEEVSAFLDMPEEELLLEANKWEISHGGLSGRTASQFITHLLGRK